MMHWLLPEGKKTAFCRLVCFVAVSILVGACASATQSTPTEELWGEEDILTATRPEQCQPIAALPKKLAKEWVLGFINPNLTHPFFNQRDAGMAAAAKFYGAKYAGLDASDGSSYNLLDSLLAQKPDLIGSHDEVSAIAAIAKAGKIPFLSVDLMPVEFDLHPYGVPNATAGKMGGELLVEGIKGRMAGDWKDKEIFFIGLTASSIPACVTRIDSAAQAVGDGLGLDEEHLLIVDPNREGAFPEALLLTKLQSNPQAVFGIIPCWDQLGIDPYKKATTAGHEDRILLVTLGGDQSNLEFLQTKPKGYYGLVEFQPYCEGWSWVETALAILEGLPFEPYQVSRTVTQSTVDERFSELYGNNQN